MGKKESKHPLNIPEIKMLALDIQLEIIKRLPVKSIIQFRSVCKAWKSFIDSSHFIAGYRTQSQHLMIIRPSIKYANEYCWEEYEAKYVSYVDDDDSFPQQNFALTDPPLLQLITDSHVIGSSGGLLFLKGYFREPDNSSTDMVVLWNPSIRKSIAIALPKVGHQLSYDVIGVGVCPYTNDPKLVRIIYILDFLKDGFIPHQVMVFTLSSTEWTCLRSNQLPRKSIVDYLPIVIGQFMYWLAYDKTDVDVDDKYRNLIMSFDMSSEEFGEIDLPDSLAHVLESNISVSRLRESLVLLEYSRETTDKQVCDVWMMEHGDSKSFTKLFTINPPNASVLQTRLVFRKSGEPIVQMYDHDKASAPYALIVYEPCSKHIKVLGNHEYHFVVYSYTESLLLLDHDDGHIVRCGDVKR